MSALPSPEVLEVVEDVLVRQQPFGDSNTILDQLGFCTERRLGIIGEHLPSAERLLGALRKANVEDKRVVTGNTVVRCAVQHAHVQIETNESYGLPREQCDAIFAEAAHRLEIGTHGTPFESGPFRLPRLGDEPYHGCCWREDYPDDVFGRSFRSLVLQNYHAPLCTPNDEEIALLRRAEQLLQRLLPSLTRSALSHTHIVGVFPNVGPWASKASSSQIRVTGTVFLGRCLFSNPWIVAEHLLHEMLHQKLYDFRHGHTLLQPDFGRRDAPRIVSPWNPEDLTQANSWDTHRAFAAFHVYAQLALLAIVARQRAAELEPEFGPINGMIDGHKAFERAWYLGEQLKGPGWETLGLAGQRFADWLISILQALEPSPPPKGSYLHLVLDLYQREAKKAVSAVENPVSGPDLVGKLALRARDEVVAASKILSDLKAVASIDQLNATVATIPVEELGTQLPKVRGAVASALLGVSPDGYSLTGVESGTQNADACVRRMVLDASQRLYIALNDIPEAVAAARRRAQALRFPMSCQDKVGRLLAVLAAAVPQGGRIFEIGSGTGVGAAWICQGLRDRTDIEVITAEINPDLAAAAAEWPWPPYVRVETGDAIALLQASGNFDLMFVDASPIKYGLVEHLDEALRHLRPSGVLVVDDLVATPNMPKDRIAAKDGLRRYLLHHSQLQAVEFEWASGVIVATRTVAPE